MGTRQTDAIQNIVGSVGSGRVLFGSTNGPFGNTGNTGNAPDAGSTSQGGTAAFTFDASRAVRTSSETRPVNVSYAPRIHA